MNALENKSGGHRLQTDRLADHNCVALGVMRGKIVAPCRLAGEETRQLQRCQIRFDSESQALKVRVIKISLRRDFEHGEMPDEASTGYRHEERLYSTYAFASIQARADKTVAG